MLINMHVHIQETMLTNLEITKSLQMPYSFFFWDYPVQLKYSHHTRIHMMDVYITYNIKTSFVKLLYELFMMLCMVADKKQ